MPEGSAEGGLVCMDVDAGGGPGDWDRCGPEAGVTFEATRQ